MPIYGRPIRLKVAHFGWNERSFGKPRSFDDGDRYEHGDNGRFQRVRSDVVGWSFDDGNSGNFHHQGSQNQGVRSFVEVVSGSFLGEALLLEKDSSLRRRLHRGRILIMIPNNICGSYKLNFSDSLNCLPNTDKLDSLSWKGVSDVSPLVSVEDDKALGEGDNCVQLIVKDEKVSKGVGELCNSENALGASTISNFKLLRGGNCIRKVFGDPNFSKLVDVGLEGCGSGKSEGLLKGAKEGPSDSTTENKMVSDQASHDDFECGAEDDGLVRLVNDNIFRITSMEQVSPSVNTPATVQASGSGLEGKVVLSNQDTFIDIEEGLEEVGNVLLGHDQSIKSRGRKKNHLVKRHGMITRHSKALALDLNQDFGKEIIVPEMKKASWNLKEELAKVIKVKIVKS
ncbi:hypothetical protein Q3G72_030364 [Acer saccharum]|nr:hypothetical protein Q3G72_030364 [Acer saccharum]